MIQLSFSVLNSCLQPHNSHCWINRQLGLKPEERPEWIKGKIVHKIIADHLAGRKLDERLKHINYKFPITESEDFDERCKFEIPIKFGVNDKVVNSYKVIGYFDGLDLENHRFLEIKASDPVWSLIKFQNSMQRKLYAFANSQITEAVLITCSKYPDRWAQEPPKVFSVPLTPQDKSDAVKWLLEGIQIIEKGDFSGGLVDGKCVDPYCYYGRNCQFK